VWGRTVSLPLPVAAAAAAVIIAAFLFIVNLRQPGQAPVQESLASTVGTDVQGIMPVSDLDRVLQYLSSQDNSDYVIIRLPESRNFLSSGEPALLKAADYTGRGAASR
jgi:hypothetical protein